MARPMARGILTMIRGIRSPHWTEKQTKNTISPKQPIQDDFTREEPKLCSWNPASPFRCHAAAPLRFSPLEPVPEALAPVHAWPRPHLPH